MNAQVIHGDCLEVMKGMADGSVDLIVTDPPYFKVKADWWDHQWEKPAAFLEWLDTVLAEFQRILKPNGSLYVFASPQMAARVEVQMMDRFNVLNHLVWRKEMGRHRGAERETLRGFFPQTERVIFAQPVDETYGEAERVLRLQVFRPLGTYFAAARIASGMERNAVDVALGFVRRKNPERGTELCLRWEEGSALPNAETYARLQRLLGTDRLTLSYQELQAWHVALQAEFVAAREGIEHLRRHFSVPNSSPATDVWDFQTVQGYEGKHPCEKPLALLEHIISVSSRPGAVVFDAFSGSGSTGEAAVRLGRQFIGSEIDPTWARRANRRIANAQPALLGAS